MGEALPTWMPVETVGEHGFPLARAGRDGEAD